MIRRGLVISAGLLLCRGADGHGQSLREQCTTAASPGNAAYCEQLVDAALTLPQRVTIAAAGGNPVAGTASTLGMRVPGSPRWSVALRSTLARAPLSPSSDSETTPTLWSVNADASIGVFDGVNLLPTIGGFASLDILGSIGVLSVPESDGFDRSSPLTWAAGVRVGILRESFTAPGVSISALYRSIPAVEFGDTVTGPYFENAAQSVTSVRGTVGKRVLGVGLTGGIGYDRTSSDVRAEYMEPGTVFPRPVAVAERDVTSGRTSFFGNVSYTVLILNMAAELGWQEDGDRPAGAQRDAGKGGLFGGIAVRLAI